MPDTVVRFESVSKKFTLSFSRPRAVQEIFLRALGGRRSRERESFWALSDASFEIRRGETVGFVGPNGAGKSTLFKLTSRILTPTTGHVYVNGRVAALLELGTGFHPDLTGRENIYLNGSLLGLSKGEIGRKIDAIIDFSELGNFIDVPVKHFSSGMYMRLGFSIAVHVDPDILLVDEVLAVGDQAFQQKCQRRVEQLGSSGVTILFVSHSLDDVRRICQRAIWMDGGKIRADGDVEWVTQLYSDHAWDLMESSLEDGDETRLAGELMRWGSQEIEINGVSFLDAQGNERRSFSMAEAFRVRIHYSARQKVESPVFGLAIYRSDGLHITGPNTRESGQSIPFVEGQGWVEWKLESLPLLAGQYDLSVAVYDRSLVHAYDHRHRMISFLVRGTPASAGVVDLPAEWEMSQHG